MDLLSPKIIKPLLAKHNATPLRQLGQNFLINRGVLQKIIAAANLKRGETVLEIGPGIGALTQELAKRVKKVVAVEKDRKFFEILKETVGKEYKNIEIIHGDILKTKNLKLKTITYKLVSNLPYNIASSVIRKFLEAENPPQEMLLMVQKEVAQRICASPPNMSLLAVSVQFYAQPKILSYASKSSFWPPPKVDAAIIKIRPRASVTGYQNLFWAGAVKRSLAKRGASLRYPRTNSGTSLFFQIVRAGFSAPRKQLVGNLTRGLKIERHIIEEALKKAGIKPSQRAETLSTEDWIRLTRCLEI